VASVLIPEPEAAATPAKSKSGFLRKLGKFVLWLIVIVVVAEIGLRFFGYGSYTIYVPDQRLLWIPRPGHGVTEVNHLPITISADRFRYPQTLGAKSPGDLRIFTFGDSVTMGWGVGDDQTYSAQLEKLLRGNCTQDRNKVQVISAGANAYPAGLAEERIKKVVEDGYQPDLVILAYSFNIGFVEHMPELQGAEREKFLERVRVKSYIRRSAIYNFLIEDLLRELVYYRLRNAMMKGSWTTEKEKTSVNVERYRAGLEATRQFCLSRHVPLVLLLLGSENQGDEMHPYQKAMMEFAAENSVPLVNAMEGFRSKDQAGLFMDHVHPTAAGHALLAEELAKTIEGTPAYAAACHQ
jgi:lysophospholipase L1-like esterase